MTVTLSSPKTMPPQTPGPDGVWLPEARLMSQRLRRPSW